MARSVLSASLVGVGTGVQAASSVYVPLDISGLQPGDTLFIALMANNDGAEHSTDDPSWQRLWWIEGSSGLDNSASLWTRTAVEGDELTTVWFTGGGGTLDGIACAWRGVGQLLNAADLCQRGLSGTYPSSAIFPEVAPGDVALYWHMRPGGGYSVPPECQMAIDNGNGLLCAYEGPLGSVPPSKAFGTASVQCHGVTLLRSSVGVEFMETQYAHKSPPVLEDVTVTRGTSNPFTVNYPSVVNPGDCLVVAQFGGGRNYALTNDGGWELLLSGGGYSGADIMATVYTRPYCSGVEAGGTFQYTTSSGGNDTIFAVMRFSGCGPDPVRFARSFLLGSSTGGTPWEFDQGDIGASIIKSDSVEYKDLIVSLFGSWQSDAGGMTEYPLDSVLEYEDVSSDYDLCIVSRVSKGVVDLGQWSGSGYNKALITQFAVRGEFDPRSVTDSKHLYLPTIGSPVPYVQTPDSAALNHGDTYFSMVAKVSLGSWTPSSDVAIMGKQGTISSAEKRGYSLWVLSNGKLRLRFGRGGVSYAINSSVATDLLDGQWQWIAASKVNNQARFYLGGSGISPSWTLLGSGFSANGNPPDTNTEPLEVGGIDEGVRATDMRIQHARVYTGVDFSSPESGTLIASANFQQQWWDTGGTQYTDSQANVWTISGTGHAWE